MRTDFVANVSHELRTPLTIIKGFSETLVDDYDSLARKPKGVFTNKIKNNTERLHLLVEDLLTLSRLESQPDQLDYSVQAFDQLLNEIKESYAGRLNESKQRLKWTLIQKLSLLPLIAIGLIKSLITCWKMFFVMLQSLPYLDYRQIYRKISRILFAKCPMMGRVSPKRACLIYLNDFIEWTKDAAKKKAGQA